MAENTEPVIQTALIPGGVYREEPQEVIPERGGLGYAWDKGVGMAQGAIDIAASPAAVARDVATPDDQPAYQAIQEAAATAKKRLSGWKTQYGQAQEEGKVPGDTSVLGTLLDAAPAAVAIGVSGAYAGPVVAGTIAHGIMGTENWDIIRHAPDEVLQEKSPKYKELRDQGLSVLDAKREIYADRNTMESLLYNVGGNMLMAGFGQHLVGSVVKRGLQTEAGNMAMRIIKNATVGGAEGVVGGAALGGGTEAGRQAGEIGQGLRDKYDLNRIYQAAVPTAENLGILGTALGGVRGVRAPVRPRVEKTLEKTGEIVEATGYTPSADEIGADLLLVGAGELGARRPSPLTRPTEGAEVTRPGEPAPSVAPRPTEVPPPVGSAIPTTPAGEPPPVRVTSPPPVERGAAVPPGEPVAPPVAPPAAPPAGTRGYPGGLPKRWTADEIQQEGIPSTEAQRVADERNKAQGYATDAEVARSNAAAAAPAEAAPTAPVAAVEPVKAPMTLEELRARAVDLNQSPTVGDLQKHIAQWKAENPGLKLGTEQNEILKANKEARVAEATRVKEERQAALEAERTAKREAAAEAKAAKAAAKAEKEKAAEVKAPPIAEAIQERVETVKAAREAAVAEEVKTPEPTVGEKVKAAAAEAPKNYAQRIKEHAAANPVERYTVEPYTGPPPKTGAYKFEAQLVDKTGEKPPHKISTMADARKEAARLNAFETKEAAARAIQAADAETAKPEVTPPGKPEVKAPVTGAKAAEAITKAAEAKKARTAAVVGAVTQKAEAAAETRAKETATKADYRDRQKTQREQAAKEIFEAHNENLGEIQPLTEKIRAGRPSQVKSDIAKVGETIGQMVKDYRDKLVKDLAEGNPRHDIFKLGEWGKSRAGHGDTHAVLSDLNNLANGIKKNLEKNGTLAKANALHALDYVKAVREGKTAELAAERTQRNEAQTVSRKTTGLGEKAEHIVDPHAQERVEGIKPEDLEDRKYPNKTLTWEEHYVNGKSAPKNQEKVDHLAYELDRHAKDMGGFDKLNDREAADIFRSNGEKILRGTGKDVLAKYRPGPEQPHLRAIYDAVHDVVKDMPVEVWSRYMMEAYYAHKYPGKPVPLGLYSLETGHVILRSDTLTAPNIFHEMIHAATSRAVGGSERLTALVNKLQDIIERKYKPDLDVTSEMPFQMLIRNDKGERISPREFIAELFSRPELADLVKGVKLTAADARALSQLGYRADIGKSIMRSLWDGFLKAIGFKAKTPNAYKVAVDLLQDMFEREMKIRDVDAASGRPTGSVFDAADLHNLALEDPVGGPGLVKKFQAGDYAGVADGLMNSAHMFSESTLDKSIQFLTKLNEDQYGHKDAMVDESHGMPTVTPLSNTEQVRGGVEKFLGDRFGREGKAADFGYQADKWFATPVRHFVQGMRYTQDLGNNLEKGFRDVLQPIKDAWSRREHLAQEYMDKSGANKLIDDIATLKHGIKDRGLWADYEKLLVRESYTRMFADEEIGIGRNSHIDPNRLRDYQSIQDHKANQALLQTIRDRDPGGRLITMRNRIHDFEAADLAARQRAQAADVLTRMKIVDPNDRVGLMALVKDVRQEKLSVEEKAAFERIVGADHTSKQFEDYVENRKVARGLLDKTDKNGPHVPFMRHGDHVVTANYHVTPDAGVKYHAIDPAAKVAQGYDFADRADAEHFVKNVLSREDIQITQTGGREVVYDTSTGEQAKIWTVEKPNGTAKTFESHDEAMTAAEKNDKVTSKEITPEDLEQRRENNQPVDHFQVYSRVEFNPREYVRFESERAANEYRNRINLDTHDPNFSIDVSNVETPRDITQRGVSMHASSEMTQWANRIEASPAYQKLTKEAQADWKRELNAEAARVTMMTGRRSINLPREYVKGTSTDILKNMIQSTGSSARAIAGNLYNPRIQLAREAAQEYTNQFKNQTGGLAGNHRARTDVLAEFDRRLHAPIRVDGSWAQGIKRALQVSMISHLADASFLVINAMEPWVLGGAMTAARHGWYGAYSELVKANALVNPIKMARMAGDEIYQAGWKGQYRPANYEAHLLDAVKGEADAKGLSGLLRHMFGRGLTARDTGMEVERIHDPSSNIAGRVVDRVDATFRGGNTGIEVLNRSTTAISNFRLEFRRAIKEGKSEAQAEAQAIRYAEEQVFKVAGDYGQWNSPRYFNNPMLKLATQFKKYPLRIASVYADAIIQATRGDKQAMKQVAYMLAAQGVAGGALGLPLSPFAGTVNAAYILGLTDNKWGDVEFGMRKFLVDQGLSPELTDLALRGALRFTGADFHPRLTQNSMIFFGDPDSRKPGDLLGTFAKTLLGAPGDWGAKGLGGFQKLIEAAGDYQAGAHDQAFQKGIQGADGIIQIKALHNIAKAFQLMSGGPPGMPKGNEATTGQAVLQAIGFGPVQIARKQEAKRVIQAEKKDETQAHNTWVNRWRDAPNTTEQSAIWAKIQKQYNPTVPPNQRIQYSDLWKAQQRKKHAEKRDDTKLGVSLSGRQKSFADIGKYFATQ
jgi:hypothetical protein